MHEDLSSSEPIFRATGAKGRCVQAVLGTLSAEENCEDITPIDFVSSASIVAEISKNLRSEPLVVAALEIEFR